MFPLYYYMNLIKLLKYWECRSCDEIFDGRELRRKIIIVLLYSNLVAFKCFFTIQGKTVILSCEENVN